MVKEYGLSLDVSDVKQEVLQAEARIRKHIWETPLDYSPHLSHLAGCNVYLKLETSQVTGSFKYRGAVNRILSLTPEEKARGIITCSSGNHGAAFTYAGKQIGCKGKLFLPENISKAKMELIQLYGAGDIELYGNDMGDTEARARQAAKETEALFISPYNDPYIIGGQGTIALELMRRMDHIDTVFVPVGGGGLMSGIAGYLKAEEPKIKTIGCQPVNSPVMYESIKAGKLIDVPSKPTLADGTAGGIEPGAITFGICRDYVDDYILITEEELEDAIRISLKMSFLLIEGAAALSVAAFLKTKEQYEGQNVVLVITGRRIALEELQHILCR
jgi:threonine dehydratase